MAKLEADADDVVRRILSGEATISVIMREYRVAWLSLMRIYKARTTASERDQAKARGFRRRGANAGSFRKGHIPWTKGLKGIRLSPATEFKKGCLRGAAARKWRPIGAITIRYDKPVKRLRARKRKGGGKFRGRARRFIKIRDDGALWKRWEAYARWVWRRANGEIPAGRDVVHLDGNTMNDNRANLAAMTQAQRLAHQMRLNPETMVAERLRRTGKASRLRHQRNRELKKIRGPVRTVWDCHACGNVLEQRERPDRCGKCGSGSLVKVKIRSLIA